MNFTLYELHFIYQPSARITARGGGFPANRSPSVACFFRCQRVRSSSANSDLRLPSAAELVRLVGWLVGWLVGCDPFFFETEILCPLSGTSFSGPSYYTGVSLLALSIFACTVDRSHHDTAQACASVLTQTLSPISRPDFPIVIVLLLAASERAERPDNIARFPRSCHVISQASPPSDSRTVLVAWSLLKHCTRWQARSSGDVAII